MLQIRQKVADIYRMKIELQGFTVAFTSMHNVQIPETQFSHGKIDFNNTLLVNADIIVNDYDCGLSALGEWYACSFAR